MWRPGIDARSTEVCYSIAVIQMSSRAVPKRGSKENRMIMLDDAGDSRTPNLPVARVRLCRKRVPTAFYRPEPPIADAAMPRIGLLSPSWTVGGVAIWFQSLLKYCRGISGEGIALPELDAADVDAVRTSGRQYATNGLKTVTRP